MNELEAMAALNAVSGIGSRTIKKIMDYFGSAKRVFENNYQELENSEILSPNILKELKNFPVKDFIEKEFSLLEKNHFHLISILDEQYPSALRNIIDPPAVLYVAGEIPSNIDCALAVVGSRHCSVYGSTTAMELARSFAEAGLCIISGMARGIDTAAHQGTLQVKGKTVAVLGSGLLEIYPRENENLFQRIRESGAVISEFPLATKPLAYNFPRRNRIISGLSAGVVIVEAARKSGALITADLALEQGKEVFAVPGQIGHLTSSGTNYLIQQGAKLVCSAQDVLEDVYALLKNQHAENIGPVQKEAEELASVDLSADEKMLLESIEGQRVHIDEIAQKTNFSFGKTASLLLNLELKHCIKQYPGKIFQKSAA